MCKTLFIPRGEKKSTWEPRCESTGICFSFFFLDLLLTAHLSFSFWLISSWTGSWQSAPYVWTIHNPSEELHNRSHPLSLWRVGDYAVNPIPVRVWRCEVMSDAVRLPANPLPLPIPPTPPTPPSLCPTPPELALWLTKRSPGEEGVLKDTAKSGCGTSRFVIIVCFKCFCKNVVNLPTLLQSLGALGWYKYSAHSVCYKLQLQCLSVFCFLFWDGLSFLVSLVNVS